VNILTALLKCPRELEEVWYEVKWQEKISKLTENIVEIDACINEQHA